MKRSKEYEELYLLTRKIIRFVNSLTNKTDCNSELYNYLESIGYDFSNNHTLKGYVQLIVGEDILNCYFLLGYQQIYKRELFMLLDMIEYGFRIRDVVPYSYSEFQSIYEIHSDFFREVFDIKKNVLESTDFPALYIYLSKVGDTRADEYVRLLQKIAIVLLKNRFATLKQKDERIDTLLSNPQTFLEDLHEDKDINPANDEIITDNNDEQNDYDMELLKDKLFNGISFEVLKEEYHEGYSNEFFLLFRISNYNDHKKKIRLDIRYISVKHGLKKEGYILNDYVPDNSFVDVNVKFEDITSACNGDRMELDVNEGKFASLRLVRERNQWMIVESIERNTYNRDLKNKIEHFEAIEEQYGITLQNFSVKMRDENSLDLFCEVLALDGKVKKSDFTIEAAIYDSDNDIVYHTSLSSHDFKGFEVYSFGPIRLDITVDEISKIRIYPIR